MINNLGSVQEKNSNYLIFSTNGNILKQIPDGNTEFNDNGFNSKVRTFGPFQSIDNTLKKPNNSDSLSSVSPVIATTDDPNQEEAPESTISDILGSVVLSSVLGSVIGHSANASQAATQKLTSVVEKGIHLGMNAIEISDSAADKKNKVEVLAQANNSYKNSYVVTAGKAGIEVSDRRQFIDNLDAKEVREAKALHKSVGNLTAQEKFQAKHKVFGKK